MTLLVSLFVDCSILSVVFNLIVSPVANGTRNIPGKVTNI